MKLKVYLKEVLLEKMYYIIFKQLDFEEFKCLLGFMANLMFKLNGERHPHAY